MARQGNALSELRRRRGGVRVDMMKIYCIHYEIFKQKIKERKFPYLVTDLDIFMF